VTTTGTLRLQLLLLDDTGTELGYADADAPGGAARLAQVQLPRDGQYLLAVGVADAADAAGADGAVPGADFTLVAAPLQDDEIALASGALTVTLRWEGAADLDLIVRDPSGQRLAADTPQIPGGGTLQIGTDADCDVHRTQPVEHAYWPQSAPEGVYEVIVWYRQACTAEAPGVAFTLRALAGGEALAQVTGELDDGAQYRTTFRFP
jgi:hypothetical protein